MKSTVSSIANRLSLRPPQRDSLEILDRFMGIATSRPRGDLNDLLAAVTVAFPTVTDFERQFPNICFSLATGVGKTRLMGAFIAYLHVEHRIRHFMVLAPNLTVYEKLVRDFSPDSPKYVFSGISEFAVRQPLLVTGDTWEAGRGVQEDAAHGQRSLFDRPIHINIFNIAKLLGDPESDQVRRLHAMREVFGKSYFDYLSSLDDLVVMMDEAHRYRADRSMETLDALRPLLGIELTATPQVVSQRKSRRFNNVVYDYPLSSAMRDGFVKEPAVATRQNLTSAQAKALGEDRLEKVKLEDGMRLHEEAKASLQAYAINTGKQPVKPFVLVIARDTAHATQLRQFLTSDAFYGGKYKDRTIEVHSGKSGEEKDDNVSLLLSVERVDNPVEIVVHVNMLKEGWDVTNLYTIIPLRTASSKTLVEQSVGRGLRLPYGKRTGDAAVDRLAIVAHDHFQEILDEAHRGGFVFSEVKLPTAGGSDVATAVVVPSLLDRALGDSVGGDHPALREAPHFPGQTSRILAGDPDLQHVARTALAVLRSHGRQMCSELGDATSPTSLHAPSTQEALARAITKQLGEQQLTLPSLSGDTDLPSAVRKTVALFIAHTILVPRVTVLPAPSQTSGYLPFTLDLSGMRYPVVDGTIVIQSLSTDQRDRLSAESVEAPLHALEDYVVRGLIEYPDICYDLHSTLLYDLAAQVVAHLRSYLGQDADVRNTLLFHQKDICERVHQQMAVHADEPAADYSVKVTPGFVEMKPIAYTLSSGEAVRDFRVPVEERHRIREMLFGGFSKSLYEYARFQSDPERALAVLLDAEPLVLKWTKPASGVFHIAYGYDRDYEPDFVVECDIVKLVIEAKREDQMNDPEVLAKAKAAGLWCQRASAYERSVGGKEWQYLLVPHSAITAAASLGGLISAYSMHHTQ
jgi:type III restriction enzyme